MIHKIQSAVFKNAYLLITAAWLFTFSFISYNYLNYNASAQKVAGKIEHYIQQQEAHFKTLASDTGLINDCVDQKIFSKKQAELLNEDNGFFIYTFNDLNNPILSFWNSNKYSIKQEDVLRSDGNYFVNYQNGDFILSKKTIQQKNNKVICIQVLPVRWNYFIENKYLQTEFVNLKETDKYYEIADTYDALSIKSINGKVLFKIKSKANREAYSYDGFTVVLRVLAVFFVALFLNAVCAELVLALGFYNAFFILLLAITALRVCSYIFPFPFNTSSFGFFDPAIYASNFIHPSLGDLFINTILFFWLVNFYRIHCHSVVKNVSVRFMALYNYISMVLITLVCLLMVQVIRGLVIDSKISFDVTNFFSLSVYSFISFIILCFLILTFFYLTHILLKPVFENNFSFGKQLIVVCITGLTILSFNIGKPSIPPNLVSLLWLIIYLFILNLGTRQKELSLLRSSKLIFWIMFFSASLSSLIIYQNTEVELQQRKRNAEMLSLQSSVEDENIFKIAFSNFRDDYFKVNADRLYTEYSNKFIKDSLLKENFSGYLNKYDTRIYTYDSSLQPLYNDDSTSYNSLHLILLRVSKPTDIPGLYSFKADKGQAGYFLEKFIQNNAGKITHILVTANPKRFSNDALYPVLFKQGQDIFKDITANYAYAIYQNGKMVKHVNDFDFPLEISLDKKHYYGFQTSEENGYSRLWYFSNGDKQILIVKKIDWLFQFVALFAWLFSLFMVILMLFFSVDFLLKNRFRITAIKNYFTTLSIKSQINLIIVSVCFVSFVIIGIATVSFFITRFNNNNEDRLFKSIKIIGEEIQTNINSHFLFDDVLTINDIGVTGYLERKIADIAESHAADVNFYDLNGKLKVSTQPYIYNKYLLSQRMNPKAYYELAYLQKAKFSQTEHIGKLSFLSLYIPVIDENGKTSAYLNIPYLNSQEELNQEISGFLATLINLNAFIFLLAGAIAYVVTNRITSSFGIISKKMKELSLGKVNEPIEWNKQDEIGELVNEYNVMVSKLDESVKALAKAERESAWREMARQVAHEIKNPLTPMKLSIQYLQKNLEKESDHIKTLSNNVAGMLVEQIDQLSKIAGDFTLFANINNANPQKINILETIESVVNMQLMDTSVNILLEKGKDSSIVYVDKTQMSRLFTNLIKNAIEAAKGTEKTEIRITVKQTDKTVLIAIADNGAGIPQTLVHKIFTPNFTTKSSGTGLGLAICKGIVENANGSIWFETKLSQGTIFYVQLPLAVN
ncbi:MAG: HAMP domain-containing histidine kinase [Sphingobacteriia bacterium]|nr:HAMP domain-containing histidine kinase [Sphingobacteriia bacterium]